MDLMTLLKRMKRYCSIRSRKMNGVGCWHNCKYVIFCDQAEGFPCEYEINKLESALKKLEG